MIKAVLDTNILISSIFWSGAPKSIVDLATQQKIKNFTSFDILAELQAVLIEDFDVPVNRIKDILRDVMCYSQVVKAPAMKIKNLRDTQDTKIVSCAMTAEAQYIITGDKDLLALGSYHGIKIVQARDFLILGSSIQ